MLIAALRFPMWLLLLKGRCKSCSRGVGNTGRSILIGKVPAGGALPSQSPPNLAGSCPNFIPSEPGRWPFTFPSNVLLPGRQRKASRGWWGDERFLQRSRDGGKVSEIQRSPYKMMVEQRRADPVKLYCFLSPCTLKTVSYQNCTSLFLHKQSFAISYF